MAQPFDVNLLNDKKVMSRYTAEEKALLRNYFAFSGGCFKKPMADSEYNNLVQGKVANLKLKEKALNKIGLDEDQLQEIPPIEIGGYVMNGSEVFGGPSGRYTNKYESSIIFFSDTQIYIYTYVLDMLSTSKKENCEEYFYKDVTNISTSEEDIEVNLTTTGGCNGKKIKNTKGTISEYYLKIVVPGDQMKLAVYNPDENFERAIKAAKNKLREKKDV